MAAPMATPWLALLLLLPVATQVGGQDTPSTTSRGGRMLPLATTEWGQRWSFAQDAPLSRDPASDAGTHERLGCLSTALAQIMYFHRRCPSGTVSYSVTGYASTGMNFSAAAAGGLCDWDRLALAPPNESSSPAMAAVARYEYAAALIVQKTWGTGTYGLSHNRRAAAAAQHYGMRVDVLRANETADSALRSAVRDSIDRRLPLQLQVGSSVHTTEHHHVVVDGYAVEGQTFLVHLNVGHSGFDNDWYDWASPICLKHYQNGTVPGSEGSGGCAFRYELKEMLWTLVPQAVGRRSA